MHMYEETLEMNYVHIRQNLATGLRDWTKNATRHATKATWKDEDMENQSQGAAVKHHARDSSVCTRTTYRSISYTRTSE